MVRTIVRANASRRLQSYCAVKARFNVVASRAPASASCDVITRSARRR